MKSVLKVAVGLLLGGLILFAGCAVLIGVGADEAVKELDRQQNENAITNSQARQLKLGTSRREVEERFGPPEDTQESENEGLGEDSCIYYNLRGGEVLESWQFCFEGAGQRGKLRSKNRL